jgi:benzoylformate decarboxylase
VPRTGSDWLIDALAAEGVTHLFGNPGSTELPLIDALSRTSAVHYVLGLHEHVAMGMADGFAQVSGRLAAVNLHVQPGLANGMAGLINARRARVPMLLTVGQQVSELLPGAPFLGGELVGMAAPLGVPGREVCADSLGDDLRWAVRTALGPPAGPVVLSLPLEIQAGMAPAVDHARAPAAIAPAPRGEDLDAIAGLLSSARAAAILVGDGVAHATAGRQTVALADLLGAPMFAEPQAATVAVPFDHGLWRGALPGFAAEIRSLLAPYDVVLALGMPVFRLFGWSEGPALAPHTTLIHIDVDPEEIGRSISPRIGLVADLVGVVEGLHERLGVDATDRRGREVARTAELRRQARARLARGRDANRVTPAGFAHAVADAIGPRDLIVDESLTAGRGLRVALGRRIPGTWLTHRGSALGWALPAAVGAKLADRGRRVMALQGDGSLLFGISALWTAAHERLPLAVVIADNGSYEILRAGLEGLTGRPEAPWPGIEISSPPIDHVALARGFGASAVRVDHPADLPAAFRDLWARAHEGPAVLVVGVSGRTPPVGYPIASGASSAPS